jgi:hypothetical protein
MVFLDLEPTAGFAIRARFVKAPPASREIVRLDRRVAS